jgi:hypothetical protein
MSERKFNRLHTAIDRRNANWLEDVEPEIAQALRDEVDDGATPEEIERFAVEVSGESERFTKKLKSAARHLQGVQAR